MTSSTQYSTTQRSRRWARFHYLRTMRLNASPYAVAMGLAIGVFVGFLPIIPLQTTATIILCIPLRGNFLIAALGTWISNPFNWVPFYWFLYVLGKKIAPWDVPVMELGQFTVFLQTLDVRELASFGTDIMHSLTAMIFAGAVLGFPCACLTFFVTRYGVCRYRERRAARLATRRLQKTQDTERMRQP